MPENDFRTACPSCKRRSTAYKAYVRHFLRDFGIEYDTHAKWKPAKKPQVFRSHVGLPKGPKPRAFMKSA